MATGGNDFRWALALLGMSGAAGLGHQILWTRRLTDLIGASVESNARVFGCFFLGWALGALAAALVLPKLRRPWRAVGSIELGVAVLCLPALLLPAWSGPIWPALGPEKLMGWPGPVIKSVLSVLVVLPPAFLMGMTLPLVTSAVTEPDEGLATPGLWLYAANTLGGALGLVLVVGFALHVLGAAGSMLLMIGLNLAVAAMCFRRDSLWLERLPGNALWHPVKPIVPGESRDNLLPRVGSMNPPPTPPRRGASWREPVVSSPPGRGAGVGWLMERQSPWLSPLLSFFSGAGVLALEVLGLELLNLKMPMAFYAPAAVLGCVVFLLACSAAATPWAAPRLGGPAQALSFCLAAAGLAIALAPLIFMSITAGRGGIVVPGSGFGKSLLRLGGVTGLSLGPAVILAGMVFPLLVCRCGPVSGQAAGRRLGRLLAINGLGGIVGAEIAYRVLLPSAGVHLALGAIGGCYALLSVGLLRARKTRGVSRLAFPIAAVAGIGLLLATTLKSLPIFLRTATFKIIEVRSGRDGALAVVERADLGRAMFLDNQYMLGSSRAAPDMERQAHLPLLLHPAPKRVGVVGLGTGITAAGALRHEAVESITVVELSAAVADAAARHFRDFNQGLCDNPRAKVQVEDAGAYMAAAQGRFDVVIGDLFTPWQPGEARLCSLEQFQATREALLPGGVFCQWLPMTQLTWEHFDTIAATFKRAFGEVHLFRNHFKAESVPVALVGFKEGKLDWDAVARRCQFERQTGRLLDPVCRHPQGLALLYLGTYLSERHREDRLNTLGNLRIELGAGRQLLAGNPSDYLQGDGDLWRAFLQQQLTRLEKSRDMPESLRFLPQIGLLASRWEIALRTDEPLASALQRELWEGIPDCIRSDSAADWSLWPGDHASFPVPLRH